MKTFVLAACVVLVSAAPAMAQSRSRTMGDHFTKALNAIEACGKLDTLAPTKKSVQISSLTARGGQVFVAIQDQQPSPIVFDLNSSRVVTEGVCP